MVSAWLLLPPCLMLAVSLYGNWNGYHNAKRIYEAAMRAHEANMLLVELAKKQDAALHRQPFASMFEPGIVIQPTKAEGKARREDG